LPRGNCNLSASAEEALRIDQVDRFVRPQRPTNRDICITKPPLVIRIQYEQYCLNRMPCFVDFCSDILAKPALVYRVVNGCQDPRIDGGKRS
jgi:hypothetical protein